MEKGCANGRKGGKELRGRGTGHGMIREVLAFCNLNNGVTHGGLSAANLNNGLGNANWNIAARYLQGAALLCTDRLKGGLWMACPQHDCKLKSRYGGQVRLRPKARVTYGEVSYAS